MKSLITLILVAGLLLAPWQPNQTQAQQIAPACYIVVLTVAVGAVMIYGLCKMCQSIPTGDQPPQDVPPDLDTNLPPPGSTIYIFHPKLHLPASVLQSSRVSVQHQDGNGAWQTDYSFEPRPLGGILSIVASDASGTPIATNTAPFLPHGGEQWAFFDFSSLPPSVTNNPASRFFRLVTQ